MNEMALDYRRLRVVAINFKLHYTSFVSGDVEGLKALVLSTYTAVKCKQTFRLPCKRWGKYPFHGIADPIV